MIFRYPALIPGDAGRRAGKLHRSGWAAPHGGGPAPARRGADPDQPRARTAVAAGTLPLTPAGRGLRADDLGAALPGGGTIGGMALLGEHGHPKENGLCPHPLPRLIPRFAPPFGTEEPLLASACTLDFPDIRGPARMRGSAGVSLGQEERHQLKGRPEREESPAQEANAGAHHCITERQYDRKIVSEERSYCTDDRTGLR